ncbi:MULTISPECIES: metalloregulator ArsR/SmtB family transcription factor [Bacillus cereus group]|uniref:Transcriptional regulator n=1 Tax=Bacillus wiedmannii TaxID=1890302 RepID=A0A242YYU1_9BACI|nr:MULTISPECIES: metalloregulator ArsR/SmtB family transcription factor [Bacillus cereus group]MBG9749644.1 ArsR family transcriptional regulator [Bacillus thuringiensis]MBG9778171.1 ArsR family transcriptional regulator [Bacillus thuringiensis]OTX84919.1 transcriptional regulator [Bacillus wiedmannii]OTZ82486.1 transcriptional regulator [Bacillus thuringiensis serovar ostriniae]
MNNFNTDNVQGLVSEENVELLKVMAHPVRLQIVSELAKSKTLNVTQLTDILEIPQSTVSQHLSKMRGKALKAERKGLEMYYHIENSKADKIIQILGHAN